MMNNILKNIWINEYETKFNGFSGYCKLCGNTGYIDTSPKTPNGHEMGTFKSFCICPNGRAFKYRIDKEYDENYINDKLSSITISIKDYSITEIMLIVQKATVFPINIEIGRGTFKIKNEKEATFFSLGICAYMDSKEEEDKKEFMKG